MVHELQDIVEYLFEEFDGVINAENQLELVISDEIELDSIYDAVVESFGDVFKSFPSLVEEWETYWEYKEVINYVDDETTIIFPSL